MPTSDKIRTTILIGPNPILIVYFSEYSHSLIYINSSDYYFITRLLIHRCHRSRPTHNDHSKNELYNNSTNQNDIQKPANFQNHINRDSIENRSHTLFTRDNSTGSVPRSLHNMNYNTHTRPMIDWQSEPASIRHCRNYDIKPWLVSSPYNNRSC